MRLMLVGTFLVLLLSITIVSGSALTDPANCLAARWELVFALNPSGITLQTDPFVYNKNHMVVWKSGMCTSDPDPIYMTDARCQCEAAKRFYMLDNPAATLENAFELYSAQVEAGIANHNDNVPMWHCEACPGTVKKINQVYKYVDRGCTCTAARESYLEINGDAKAANYDAVGFLERYKGARPWVSCDLCAPGTNPVYVDNPGYVNCPEALSKFRSESSSWWTAYYNDTFLAYWNSMTIVGIPFYHYELCTPTPGDTAYTTSTSGGSTTTTTSGSSTTGGGAVLPPSIVNSTVNCMEARFDVIFKMQGQGTAITTDVYVWALTNNAGGWNNELCHNSADPVYLNEARCQCDAAKQYYTQDDPAATMATAFARYSARAESLDATTPMWHCEACPNTITKKNHNYRYLNNPSCACTAAREAYLNSHADVKMANYDPVGFQEMYGGPAGWGWDCSLCTVNPKYVDDPQFATNPYALDLYRNDGVAWWAPYFYDTFLAYWNAFTLVGRPPYYYDATEIGPAGSLPPKCKCTAARWTYWEQNLDVYGAGFDPVWFQETVGQQSGRSWTCDVCDIEPVYFENATCQCDAAKQDFIARYPAAAGTDPYSYYKKFLNSHNGQLLWRCELCPGAFSNNMEKLVPALLNPRETCMAARLDFWDRFYGGYGGDQDPVYGYTIAFTSRPWNGHLCDQSATYINDTRYRCPVAETLYKLQYSRAQTFLDPFHHYALSYRIYGYAYHAELCPSVNRIPDNCECIAAKVDFWERYPEVASLKYDPVYFMEIFAANDTSYTWNCNLCQNKPVYISDTSAQCSAAAKIYSNQYLVGSTPPMIFYLKHPSSMWHAEACEGAVPMQIQTFPSFLASNCTCLAARQNYIDTYPQASGYDPVYHYISTGHGSGLQWACELCSSSDAAYISNPNYRCTDAQTTYGQAYPESMYYYDPFIHYWNHYLTRNVVWPFEQCAPAVPTTPPTRAPLSNQYTCLAARNDFWARNTDVLASNVDPVYFYTQGTDSSRKWNFNLCNSNAIYVDNQLCNCSAAALQYKTSYPSVAGDPFAHYLSNNNGNAWHCELCQVHANKPNATCGCIASTADYLSRYPDSAGYDALYHYEWFGSFKGYVLNCDLCSGVQFQPTDSVCNCAAANKAFSTALPYQSGTDYFKTYRATRALGNSWRCDLCTTTVVDPSSTLTCNCTAARSEYKATNPSISADPWTHYTTTGKYNGLEWNCQICNDTCPGRYAANILAHQSHQIYFSDVLRNATIPNGCYVGISNAFSISAANVFINGTFGCADMSAATQIKVLAAKVWVYGTLACGTEAHPFGGNMNITLYGPKPINGQLDRIGGDKSVSILGGKMQLHGKKLVSWTRLAITADPGATAITVIDPVDWEVGDKIVIATSANFHLDDTTTALVTNEVMTIAAVNGKVITLTAPLAYQHLSTVYDLNWKGLVLNKQAEVGLLSRRNIIIQGDDSSAQTGWGGHVMVLSGGRAYVSGLQLYQAGQKATLARYPFHWHMLGDIPYGQYIRNSSVAYSYNRCFTVHGTNNTLVANNVCYDFIGHGYFLEDGVEVNNTFDGNLGILCRRPPTAEAIIPSDIFNGPHSYGPSIFWFSNPNNNLINNVGVATVGSAFWIEIESAPTGLHVGVQYNPQSAPWGTIKNNLGHGVMEGFSPCPVVGGIGGTGNFAKAWQVDGTTIYGSYLGLWPCGQAPQNYTNTIIAEVQLGMQVPTPVYFSNMAMINYETPNIPSQVAGIHLYDSGWTMNGAYFENFVTPYYHAVFRAIGSARFNTSTSISDVTYKNSPSLFGDWYDSTFGPNSNLAQWGHMVNDLDGTLTGTNQTGWALVSDHPLMLTPECHRIREGYYGFACPHRYTEVDLVYDNAYIPGASIQRYNWKKAGDNPMSGFFYIPPPSAYFYWSSIANTDYVAVFNMPLASHTRLSSIQMPNFNRQGDTVALEIRNVRSSNMNVINAAAAASCTAVFNNTQIQSYYWDATRNIFCVRVVATELAAPLGAYKNRYISLSLSSGNNSDHQVYGPTWWQNGFNYELPQNETCLQARLQYWIDHPDVGLSSEPVWHYQMYGWRLGNWAWAGYLCAPDVAIYVEDPVKCGCAAAKAKYLSDNPQFQGLYDAHDAYMLFRYFNFKSYHCELCFSNTTIPSVPPTQTPTKPPTQGPTTPPTSAPTKEPTKAPDSSDGAVKSAGIKNSVVSLVLVALVAVVYLL